MFNQINVRFVKSTVKFNQAKNEGNTLIDESYKAFYKMLPI